MTRTARVYLTRLRGTAVAFDATRRELFILSDDAVDVWERLDTQTNDLSRSSPPENRANQVASVVSDSTTRVLLGLSEAGLVVGWRAQDRQT